GMYWMSRVCLPWDQTSVRKALLEAISPWSIHGRDGGVDRELRAQASVDVVQVSQGRGVVVERFPRQWRCRVCGRLTTQAIQRCRCNSTSIAQMQHVAYHTCGALQEPQLPRCGAHQAVAV